MHFGPNDPAVAMVRSDLAVLYTTLARYMEASRLFDQARQVLSETLGPKAPVLGDILQGLATVYYRTGRVAEADKLYQQALDLKGVGRDVLQDLDPVHKPTAPLGSASRRTMPVIPDFSPLNPRPHQAPRGPLPK